MRLFYVVRVVGGLLFFVLCGYDDYLSKKLPRMADETVGRIYPLAFRGTGYGYANQTEIVIYWGIFVVGVALVVIPTWIEIRTKKKA